MFYYARSDTHYLLYIYDMMRNELAELSALDSPEGRPIDRVIKKSKEVSLQRFENPFCDEETGAGNRGWYNTLLKSPTLYNGEQFAVYKAVHKWRDNVARQDDESTGFIMTQQVLSDIARIMPTDMKALWSILESNARGLKVRLGELFEVIQKAREKGANGPTMMEFFRQSSTGTLQTADKPPVIAAVEEEVEPLNIEELKSDRSQLWGDVALNSRLDGSAKPPPMDDQELIPLYTFDFGAVKEELPEATKPPPKSAPAEAAPPQENEGFTLRAGRKRKASDADMEPASEAEVEAEPEAEAESESDVEMGEGPEAEAGEDSKAVEKARKQARKDRQREKKQVKREAKELTKNGDPDAAKALLDDYRRTQRAARRAQKQGTTTTTTPQQDEQPSSAASPSAADQAPSAADQQAPPSDEQDEAEQEQEQPFDYAKASSVLHASKSANSNNTGGARGGKGGKGKRGGGNKPAFDPYAKKSGDAPGGARKMNYERSGRTATFKK
jgi:exosome complex exonuclease RRP6